MTPSEHTSLSGIEEEEGFFFVSCVCGVRLGPVPDHETMVDLVMDHAYEAGRVDGRRSL